jgi:hypothetical protein
MPDRAEHDRRPPSSAVRSLWRIARRIDTGCEQRGGPPHGGELRQAAGAAARAVNAPLL